MTSARAAARSGAFAMLPLALGVAPFGLVVGATAAEAGFSLGQAVGLSVGVFAGASQLATIDLLDEGAPLAVVVATALVINLRMLMYSASLAPHASAIGRRGRAAMSYLLVDQAYALSIVRWEREVEPPRSRLAFFVGVAAPLWCLWQLTTVAGFVAGEAFPEEIPLDFSVTLVFLAVLVPTLTDRPRVVAALAAGTVAVAAQGLPANLGLVAGATCGIVAGVLVESRWGR